MKTILVIPAYNEGQCITSLIQRARQYVDQVIVVDDGSKDQTTQEIKKLNDSKAIVLRHRINLGKGAALKTGYQAAINLGADIVFTIDGDGQHPPEHIPAMLSVMEKNNWQAILGARNGGDKMPPVRRLGNWAINTTARVGFNLKTTDIWCGMRAIRASSLSQLNWYNNDYSGEVQMALKIGQNKLSYGEYIIPTVYNDKFKGVMIFDGLKLLARMIIWRIQF